jgi:Kef-type K+ transport system membrane component KefB
VPALIGALALLGTIAAAAVCGWDIRTRPACQPGFNRLIDFAALLPLAAGFIALFQVGFVVLYDRKTTTRRGVGVASAVAVFSLLVGFALLALAVALAHADQVELGNCWTF